MKTILAIAAVFSLSASAAVADCAWHNKTADAGVDRTITTASVKTTAKQARLPATAASEGLILKEEQEAPVQE